MPVVKPEEIERAADSLVALSLAGEGEWDAIAVAVARRLADIPGTAARARRAHAVVQVALQLVKRASRVRHLAAAEWGLTHGELGVELGVPRSTAQTIVEREGVALPWEPEG